jgi:hypothetical protein
LCIDYKPFRTNCLEEKKHYTAKKDMRLEKYGYFAKKGKFGYVRGGTRKNENKNKF